MTAWRSRTRCRVSVMIYADRADSILNKKELWHQPSAAIQKVWFSPSLLVAELVLWLWKVVPRNMTYCAFDSLEISTCVRVPFYVTPPHSQPFNMMHICTSTATNPPPRSTPTSAKHTNRHTRRQMRAPASPRARAPSHRRHRFVCACWKCNIHADRRIHAHTYVLTGDLFLFLVFLFFNLLKTFLSIHWSLFYVLKRKNKKKRKKLSFALSYKTGAYALPSSSYITHHANERECHSSAADGQGW